MANPLLLKSQVASLKYMEARGHHNRETGPSNTLANSTFGIIPYRMMLIFSLPMVRQNVIWISTASDVPTFFPSSGELDHCFTFLATFTPGVANNWYNMTAFNGHTRLAV